MNCYKDINTSGFLVFNWPYVNILIPSDPSLPVSRRDTQRNTEFKSPLFLPKFKLDPMPKVGRMLPAPGKGARHY